jgi:hypothetical protein
VTELAVHALPPERRRGGPATAAGDLWSMGLVIARWLGATGDDPLAEARRRHPALAEVIAPLFAEDPTARPTDLSSIAYDAWGALEEPYADEPGAKAVAAGRRTRRKRPTARGHASVEVPSDSGDLTMPRERIEDGPSEVSEVIHQGHSQIDETRVGVPEGPIRAVSMKPGGPSPIGDRPTPAPPTPQLARPVIRPATAEPGPPPMGRLAPPRAVAEASRREARRPLVLWIIVTALAVGLTLTVLLLR